MNFLNMLKKNALTILLVIVLIAIWTTVYDKFFSNKAKLIKEYKNEIKAEKEKVDKLTMEYNKLNEEEKQRIGMIEALKKKLEELKTAVANNETDLNEIKDETIDIETALQELENHTRGSVSRGKDVLASLAASPAD